MINTISNTNKNIYLLPRSNNKAVNINQHFCSVPNNIKNTNLNNNFKQIPSFRGNINFVLVNPIISHVSRNKELNQIANILTTLGVKNIEIGDNLVLARLLKSAMYRVKMTGFDVPKIIKCESKIFKDEKLFKDIQHVNKTIDHDCYEISVPGFVQWDHVNRSYFVSEY